jgi:glycosyltransferase involved in cell wall biosynthesis
MRIINIMQDVRPVNMGIKEAATNTCSILFSKFNVSTELWFYGSDYKNLFHTAIPVPLESRSIACLKKKMQDRNLNSDTDIIITHGPWNYQSIWGSFLAKKNFKWIFVPHGTLEPCGISQKWLKKKIYYSLLEKRMLSGTSVIRAISTPEKQNLHQRFPGKEIVLIPNGFDASKNIISTTEREKRIFLFMARLHPQKGIVPLLKAWLQSSLNNDESFFLAIAGPDEGELNKMTPYKIFRPYT